MNTEQPSIELPHCTLRGLRVEDAASITHHANDRRIARYLRDIFPYPYHTQDAEAFIALCAEETRNLHFGIEVDGEVAGVISIHGRSDVHRLTGEIGYWIGHQHWGRGLVTEAVRALTKFALTQANG